MTLVPGWIWRSTRAYRRFAQTSDSFQVKLDAAGGDPWAPQADALLKKADKHAAEHDLNGAWFCLHEAMRAELPYLHGQALRNREEVLRSESTKIDSAWRKSAIEVLLKDDGANEKERALRLEKAQWLLDDYFQTQYYKTGLAGDQMRNLVIISFAALLMLLVLIAIWGNDLASWGEFDWKTLFVIFIFGILGASFSATRKLADDSGKSRIPEMAALGWITVARTVLGATPALFAYAFLKSDMLQIVPKNFPTVLAVSFAAGFSERFVLKMLESLDSKGAGKGDKKDGRK